MFGDVNLLYCPQVKGVITIHEQESSGAERSRVEFCFASLQFTLARFALHCFSKEDRLENNSLDVSSEAIIPFRFSRTSKIYGIMTLFGISEKLFSSPYKGI